MSEDRKTGGQVRAWQELHRGLDANRPRRRRLRDRKPLYLFLSVALLAAMITPTLVVARGEGEPINVGERNPSSGGSSRETALIADVGNSGLVMRPSNTAKGGRAISATCDNDGLDAEDGCAVYVNKGQGAAASFRTAGSIPFAVRDTNRGMVKNLNSELHGDKMVRDMVMWGILRYDGGANVTLLRGFGATAVQRINTGNYRMEFERDVSQCSFQSSPGNYGGQGQNPFQDMVSSAVANDNQNANRAFIKTSDSNSGNDVDTDVQVSVHC